MSLPYAFTPDMLPLLLSAPIQLILALYAWRHREVAGATPFALVGFLFTLTTLANALEIAATDLPLKIFWRQIWFSSLLPQGPLSLAVAVEYAGLKISRRTWALLSLIPFLALLLMLTNDEYHLIWTRIWFDEQLQVERGLGNWLVIVYSYLLRIVGLFVFASVFVRSHGLYRWQAAVLGFAGTAIWLGIALRVLGIDLPIDLDESVAGNLVSSIIFAWGLLRFRTFDLAPVARGAVILQMREGMLVLDNQGRLVDLNPAARQLLGISRNQVLGSEIDQVLNLPDLVRFARTAIVTPTEQRMQLQVAERCYQVTASPLIDGRGFRLGALMILDDITELTRTQQELHQQQRALAVLQERERVARELHDSLGQVLGYVKVQAQAARGWLAQDHKAQTDDSLIQLIAVAQEAHTDVREYILGAKMTPDSGADLLPTLKLYLQRFGEQYKIRTELIAPTEPADGALEPMAEVQVLRIVQEALTNARKHARASSVQVRVQWLDNCAQVVVQDDGVGFDPAVLATEAGQKFGVGFMRDRAEQVGGSVQVLAASGEGTRVVVTVPRRI